MEFRQATENDIQKIWDFFKAHDFIEESATLKEFTRFMKNMYFENVANTHYQIVAEDNGEIIAHEAAIAFDYMFYGNKLLLGLGSNTLVHKNFRQMLTFLQMQTYFFKNYRAFNLNYLYGLVTRQDVLKVHLRTGFKKIQDVHVFARPYKIKNILHHSLKSKYLKAVVTVLSPCADFALTFFPGPKGKSIIVKEEVNFKEDWDSTLKKHYEQFPVTAIKNSLILNWRFKNLSYRNYILLAAYDKDKYVGYIVLRRMKMQEFLTLAVVDLLCDVDDNKTFNTLLYAAHKLALKLKVDLMSTIISPHSKFLNQFKAKAFLKTPEFFTLVANQPQDSIVKFPPRLPEDWHITWYDHDFV